MKRILLILLLSALTTCNRQQTSSPPLQEEHLIEEPQVTEIKQQSNQPLNIYVTEEGMYELNHADLQTAGFTITTENASKISLTWRGQSVSTDIVSQENGFSLRFYGQPPESSFSNENIYQLKMGTANQMTQAALSTLDITPQDIYTATIHSEQNLQYAPQANTSMTWFWQTMLAPSTHSFEIELSQVSEGPAHLSLGISSDTHTNTSPDHHIQANINGENVLDASWDDVGYQVLEANIPIGILTSGTNQIEITLPGDTKAAAERNYLDWIEVQYPRQALAENDTLTIVGAANPVHAKGFSGNVTLWQIDSLTETTSLKLPETAQSSVIIPVENGKQYTASGPQGFQTAILQPTKTNPDLRQLLPATYLVIGPTDLLAPTQPLIEQYNEQGLATAAISLEVIYDQFNHGFPEPEAIQHFLRYTAENWPEAPQYVLLVGDYTFDPHGYTAPPEANRLPTFFIQTTYGGETASDTPFAFLDDDELPDLTVGRIPARTPEQVQIYLDKALSYEAQKDTKWRQSLLAIADGQEASFKKDAQHFLDGFSTLKEKNLLAPPAGSKDANTQILTYFKEGYGLIGYFGHGSLNMWGKDRLFTTKDIEELKNGEHLPVVINMNCLTGLFTHPKAISLAEVFLWQPEGGAVAILAPTSLTLPTDQVHLSDALAEEITANPQRRLGENFLAAQRQMPVEAPGAREVLLTFLYFGDPALHLWPDIQTQER